MKKDTFILGDFVTEKLGITYYEPEDNKRKANSVDKYKKMEETLDADFYFASKLRGQAAAGIKKLDFSQLKNFKKEMTKKEMTEKKLRAWVSKKGKDVYIDKERGYVLLDLINSPISRKKEVTALYKFAGDGEFKDMSINNMFKNPLSKPVSRPLKEYIPQFSVGEIALYKHKSTDKFYVSHTRSGSVPHFEITDTDIKRLRLFAPWAPIKYYLHKIEFETAISEILFLRYWKIIT